MWQLQLQQLRCKKPQQLRVRREQLWVWQQLG